MENQEQPNTPPKPEGVPLGVLLTMLAAVPADTVVPHAVAVFVATALPLALSALKERKEREAQRAEAQIAAANESWRVEAAEYAEAERRRTAAVILAGLAPKLDRRLGDEPCDASEKDAAVALALDLADRLFARTS